jgi:hypothetical protein
VPADNRLVEGSSLHLGRSTTHGCSVEGDNGQLSSPSAGDSNLSRTGQSFTSAKFPASRFDVLIENPDLIQTVQRDGDRSRPSFNIFDGNLFPT